MPTIVFIEDQPDTIEDFLDACEDLGFDCETVTTPTELVGLLNSEVGGPAGPNSKIVGVAVDIMLQDVLDLGDIGYDVDTSFGTTAGMLVIKFLFNGDAAQFSHVPYCILTQLERKEAGKDDIVGQFVKKLELIDEAPTKVFINKYHSDAQIKFGNWLKCLESD